MEWAVISRTERPATAQGRLAMLDYAVLVGRFQPFHNGHQAVLDRALKEARTVIVLIGSSNLHRSPKNPFTYEERVQMIGDVYGRRWRDREISLDPFNNRIVFRPLNDFPDRDALWITAVGEIVESVLDKSSANPKIGFVSFSGDTLATADGKWFPQWEPIDMKVRQGTISATAIREQYLQAAPIIGNYMPIEVQKFLQDFSLKPEFKWLLNEARFLRSYADEWGEGPFVTADAVVEQSGHILLVTRKHPPYEGALALPGGFAKPNERLIATMARELREETHISDNYGPIPIGKIKTFIKGSALIDTPERDPRGGIVTMAYHLELPKSEQLFRVRGDDDAAHAQWYDIANLKPDQLMADHWFIIQRFIGVNWK